MNGQLEIFHIILNSRPRWMQELNIDVSEINLDEGIIYTGNPKVLKQHLSWCFRSYKTSRILYDRNKMKKIVILMPVYNDWESLLALFKRY